MATVRITYFGMDGQGATVTEAKRDAGAKIESAMNGSYEPEVLSSRGWAIILWRSPQGWHSNIIAEPKDGFRQRINGGSGRDDRTAGRASALLNLARLSWDGSELIPPCLEEVSRLSALNNGRDTDGRRLLGEFRSWRGFQLAYRRATANGLADCEAHTWACHHSAEFAAA